MNKTSKTLKLFSIFFVIVLSVSFLLSASLKAYSNENFDVSGKTYKIAYDGSFAPFEFQNPDSSYSGICVDLMKEIAEIENFKIENKFVGFSPAVAMVQSGQADGAMGGMSITEERKVTMDFSSSYYVAKIRIGVPSSNEHNIHSYDDLNGLSVGVKIGTSSEKFLNENQEKYHYTIKKFEQADEMYRSLNINSVDAIMDDEPIIAYKNKLGVPLEMPIPGEEDGDYGFAVKKGMNRDLLAAFNDGLTKLKASGEYDNIVNKYLSADIQTTQDESNFFTLIKVNYKTLLKGFSMTILLAFLSFFLALIIAVFFGIWGTSRKKVVRKLVSIYVDLIRGIPLMVLTFFIFFGIPQAIGHPINEFVAATLALTLNASAYLSEIVRGGILAVPRGQKEAALSIGMTKRWVMIHVLLPQAVKIMLPSFINQFVISLKDTTIVSVIGFIELLQAGKIIIARNFQGFGIYLIIAVMYLITITVLTKIANQLDKNNKK